MPRNNDRVRIDCKIIHPTARALLIEVEDAGQVWIPQSCIHEIHDDKREDQGWVVMDEWIAKEKGIL